MDFRPVIWFVLCLGDFCLGGVLLFDSILGFPAYFNYNFSLQFMGNHIRLETVYLHI